MANQLQLTFVNFRKDAYIVVEGKLNADRFYIIRSGTVKISKEIEVVAEEGGGILAPGDFFGVVSTMSSHSHIETAQALTDVTLISVQKDQYSELIQKNSPVAMKIIFQFSKRLRFLDGALSRLTLKNKSHEEADSTHLYDVGDYYLKQSSYKLAFYAYSKFLKYNPHDIKAADAKAKIAKIGPYVKGLAVDRPANEFNRAYQKDTMIFSEGEPGEELYIIQKGAVKIARIMAGKEVLLAVLKESDIFGEMAILESKPRAASAVAYSDCVLMAVNKANFERMVTTQPQIIARLTTLLSERIWLVYKQLVNTLLKDPLGRMYDALLMHLEKNRVPLFANNFFTFDFGPNELANMVGLSASDVQMYMSHLFDGKNIVIQQDKIHALNVLEIAKQADYFRRMQHIENSRRESNAPPKS